MHKGRKFTLLITHWYLTDRNEIISRYWLLLRWTSRSIDPRGKYWPRWSQGQYLPQRTGNLNAHQYIKVICEFLHTFSWHNIMKALYFLKWCIKVCFKSLSFIQMAALRNKNFYSLLDRWLFLSYLLRGFDLFWFWHNEV